MAAGAFLLGALRLAPTLTGTALLALSVLWLAVLVWLLWMAFRVLRTLTGPVAAAAIVGLGAVTPIVLTSLRPAPQVAVRLPCPRNWAYLPTWLLRASPMASLRLDVGGARVKLCYGRPAARGRKMLGGPPVPFGRLWRTGANEPTTIISTAPIEVAGIAVPAGRASLYTVPGPETWEIIVNASTSQWGIESAYDDAIRARELGRAILASERLTPHRERLLIQPIPDEAGGRTLSLEWESTRVRIPVRLPR